MDQVAHWCMDRMECQNEDWLSVIIVDVVMNRTKWLSLNPSDDAHHYHHHPHHQHRRHQHRPWWLLIMMWLLNGDGVGSNSSHHHQWCIPYVTKCLKGKVLIFITTSHLFITSCRQEDSFFHSLSRDTRSDGDDDVTKGRFDSFSHTWVSAVT